IADVGIVRQAGRYFRLSKAKISHRMSEGPPAVEPWPSSFHSPASHALHRLTPARGVILVAQGAAQAAAAACSCQRFELTPPARSQSVSASSPKPPRPSANGASMWPRSGAMKLEKL